MIQLLSATLLLSFAATLPVWGQQATQLEPDKPTERTLAPNDKHTFEIVLSANQFVYGEADQQTGDVVVTVYHPDGRPLDAFDGPARGPEPFQFKSEGEGTYRIEVTPFRVDTGRYVIQLLQVEPVATTPEGQVDQLMMPHSGNDRPGGVVAVFRQGEVAFAKAYGMADLTHSIPNTPETLFNIGSVSKQFAGITFAMLAEQDSLSLDDDVRTYLPELPDFGPTITLRHLLNHTSGYREVYGVLALEGRRVDGDILKREDAIAVVQRQPELQFEPGSEFVYNSTGYVLLTEIAERVTGMSYPDWMQQHVFRPLEMTNTMIEREPGDVIPNSAYSYTTAVNGGYREDFESYAYYGATDVYINVYDLASWLRNFRTHELGGPGVMERMLEKSTLTNGDTLGYTLGLFLDQHRGLRRIQHGGSTGGYRAFLAYYPDLDAGVAVLSNTGAVGVGNIAEEVAATFFAEHLAPEEAEPEPTAEEGMAVAPDLLNAYAGTYTIENGPTVRIIREGDGLVTQVEGQPRFALVALADTLFQVQIPGEEARVSFHRESDGRVEHGTIYQNGETPIRRVEPWSPSVQELNAYAGRYFSKEVEAFYTLTVESDTLMLHHRRLGDVALEAKERDRFGGDWPLSELTFERSEGEQVTGFRISNGRMRRVLFEKQE